MLVNTIAAQELNFLQLVDFFVEKSMKLFEQGEGSYSFIFKDGAENKALRATVRTGEFYVNKGILEANDTDIGLHIRAILNSRVGEEFYFKTNTNRQCYVVWSLL